MRITVLGLGRMGTPMARNLIELGHEVTLYDRNRERAVNMVATGARVKFTVAEAVAEAQVALTMVTDGTAEEALTFGTGGLLQALPAGAIHLCMSSIGVETSRALAAAHADAGQGYVAAPVLGRPSSAASRHLWVLVSGAEAQVKRCLVILEALGRGITHVGPQPELAHALKLGASVLSAAMVETLSEVLVFGEKAGYPPADYLRVLNLGLFKSPLMDAFGGMMVRQDHAPADQTLDLARKDLLLALGAAREMDVPMPVAGSLLEELESARAGGLGILDLSVLSQVRRRAAGMDGPPDPVRAGPEPSSPPAPAPEPSPAPGAQPRSERRKAGHGRKTGEPERRKKAVQAPEKPPPESRAPEPSPLPPGPRVEGSRFSARGAQGVVMLDLGKTTHFEEKDGILWAWVEGQSYATFWGSLADVEVALGQILLVRAQRKLLVNPQCVRGLRPLFGGRARVDLGKGVELTAGREAARRLTFLLGL